MNDFTDFLVFIIAPVAVILALVFGIPTYANLDATKAAACDTWKQVGYTCVGYEGYEWGSWRIGTYGGAKVWNTLKRDEAPGIIYSGAVQRWGDEYHIYGPRAIDAIKGQ